MSKPVQSEALQYYFIEADSIFVGTEGHQFYVLASGYDPDFNGFFGHFNGCHNNALFISESVPKEFREHLLMFEARLMGQPAPLAPGTYKRLLLHELAGVPANIAPAYAQYRFDQLSEMIENIADEEPTEDSVRLLGNLMFAMQALKNWCDEEGYTLEHFEIEFEQAFEQAS